MAFFLGLPCKKQMNGKGLGWASGDMGMGPSEPWKLSQTPVRLSFIIVRFLHRNGPEKEPMPTYFKRHTHPKCWVSTPHHNHAVADDSIEEASTWYHGKYPWSVLYRGVSSQSPACNPHHENCTEESEQQIKQELTHVWHLKTHITFFSWFAFCHFY